MFRKGPSPKDLPELEHLRNGTPTRKEFVECCLSNLYVLSWPTRQFAVGFNDLAESGAFDFSHDVLRAR